MQIMYCSLWSTCVILKTNIATISFKKSKRPPHNTVHPECLTYLAQVYWTDVLTHHSTEHYEPTMNSSSVFDTQYLERKQNIDMWYRYISLFIFYSISENFQIILITFYCLNLPFKSTFRKILKMSNMFSEAFWTDLGLCWISVKDTMSVWFPWSMALLSITWVMSLHVFVFSTQNVVGSLVFGVLEKIKNME